MLIIKQRDFENIGYYNLELQIINLVIGYGNSNISLTPICGMLNNYKEERRKNDKNGYRNRTNSKINFRLAVTSIIIQVLNFIKSFF